MLEYHVVSYFPRFQAHLETFLNHVAPPSLIAPGVHVLTGHQQNHFPFGQEHTVLSEALSNASTGEANVNIITTTAIAKITCFISIAPICEGIAIWTSSRLLQFA